MTFSALVKNENTLTHIMNIGNEINHDLLETNVHYFRDKFKYSATSKMLI